MDLQDISYISLERYSYRNLQQIAKSCGLPSNVKKMYLIEMIIAKKHCTESQLTALVTRVKEERRKTQSQNKNNKKKGKRLQGYEVSSTSQKHFTNHQPQSPIFGTPKRSLIQQYTPDVTISKFQPPKSKQKTIVPKLKESDRILRSFNSKNPSYRSLECKDKLNKSVKTQNPMQVTQEIRSSTVERALHLNPRVQRKVWNASICLKKRDSRIVPVQKNDSTQPPPVKRQRTVSGINPLKPAENISYEYLPTVDFRRNDGKVSKINALVEKPRKILYHPIKVTMQEVINRKVDNTIRELPKTSSMDYMQTNIRDRGTLTIDSKPQIEDNEEIQICVTTTLNTNVTSTLKSSENMFINCGDNALQIYRNPPVESCGTNTFQSSEKNTSTHGTNTLCYGSNSKTIENSQSTPDSVESPILNTNTYTNVPIKEFNSDTGNYTVYYHKKIRAEQIRRVNVQEEMLPKINEVFSQFNQVEYRSVTQPLQVQVSEGSQIPQHYNGNENTSMLESLYNFKLQFVLNQPLLQIVTTSSTRCVFSTTTAPTAVALPTPASHEYNSNILYEGSNQYNLETDTRLYDYTRTEEQDPHKNDFSYAEVFNRSSSPDTSTPRGLGTNITFPEMVEDALELISQDGDYLERLDVKMHCVLCEWAGSKIILEYHIKLSHQEEILFKDTPNFIVSLTLGALVSHGIWLSQVIEYNDNLYVVSANYDENYISLLLTTPSETNSPRSGQITIYNKITGQPFTWKGEIFPIPDTLPFTTTYTCLKLDITSLDLLPNNATLKLVNNELKIVSDNKVVIEQPSLNAIDIILHVTVFD